MFEQLLMQVVNGTVPVIPVAGAGVDPTLAYVGGIAATLFTSVMALIKSGGAKQLAELAGQVGLTGLKKGVEAKGDIKDLLKALESKTPEEQAKIIEAAKVNIEKQAVEVNTGLAQVRRILAQKPEFNDEKLNIPREHFDTTPKEE